MTGPNLAYLPHPWCPACRFQHAPTLPPEGAPGGCIAKAGPCPACQKGRGDCSCWDRPPFPIDDDTDPDGDFLRPE